MVVERLHSTHPPRRGIRLLLTLLCPSCLPRPGFLILQNPFNVYEVEFSDELFVLLGRENFGKSIGHYLGCWNPIHMDGSSLHFLSQPALVDFDMLQSSLELRGLFRQDVDCL